jgi:dTDP-4-dehydrorhamnose 3,5-epimerase
MHILAPPRTHAKLVYCLTGRVLDVLVDLRVDSPTRNQFVSKPLSGSDSAAIYIPEGVAHGFYVLEGPAVLTYLVTAEHSPSLDVGVHWNSIGFDWPDCDPIVSQRDANLPFLGEFASPFSLDTASHAN